MQIRTAMAVAQKGNDSFEGHSEPEMWSLIRPGLLGEYDAVKGMDHISQKVWREEGQGVRTDLEIMRS